VHKQNATSQKTRDLNFEHFKQCCIYISLQMRTSLLKAGDWQKMLGQLKQLLSTIGVESNVEELDSVVTAFGDRLLAGMNYQPQRKFGGKVTLLKADENEATAQLPFDYRLSEVR
jgi:hypothetical protein